MKAHAILFSLLASTATPKLGNALAESMLFADMLGQLEDPHRAPDSVELAAMGTPTFTQLPFAEAKAFFQRKAAMTPSEFAELEDRYGAKGFSIAGVHHRQVLEEAHAALSSAIADGLAEDATIGRIRESFKSAGVDDPGAFQLQTTFDNAILGSYAAGRYAQLTRPSVLAARPYWEYHTAGDNRVRPAHRAMNGRVFAADSPVWQTWYPPNGHRCRCGIITRSRAEVEARGIVVADEVPRTVEHDGAIVNMLPDPGFSGSPATQIAADQTVELVRTRAHGIGALGQAADDLNRAADPQRRRRIAEFTGLDERELEAELRRMPVFNVFHVAEAEAAPATNEAIVDWHMYSQNLDTAEQLVTRLVQEHGLYRLKDRIAVAARATYFSEWDPLRWPDPEVVHDDGLARKLGVADGLTVASSTEYAIRLRAHPSEMKTLLGFLDGNGERHPGASPVRRAWEIQDVRIRAGAGVELPDDARWKPALRNVRATSKGREIVVLSKKPLDGFDRAEPIAVNASLWELL